MYCSGVAVVVLWNWVLNMVLPFGWLLRGCTMVAIRPIHRARQSPWYARDYGGTTPSSRASARASSARSR